METKPRTYAHHPITNTKITWHPVTLAFNFWKPFPGGRCLVCTAQHNCLKFVLQGSFYNVPIEIPVYQQ